MRVIQRHGVRDLWIREPCVMLLVEPNETDVDRDSLRLACDWDTIVVGNVTRVPSDATLLWPMVPRRNEDLSENEDLRIVPISFDIGLDGKLAVREHRTDLPWGAQALTTPQLLSNTPPNTRVLGAYTRAFVLADAPPVSPKPKRTLVYQHFDQDRTLLYIGITDDPKRRADGHSSYSIWSQFAATMTGEWLPSRAEAEKREQKLIESLAPVFNVAYVDPGIARQRRADYLRAKGRSGLLDAA